jgi:hypothetical protein
MEFKYLGFLISNNNSITVDMYHRILVGNMSLWAKKSLTISLIKEITKCKICKTLIRPVYYMDVIAGLSQKQTKRSLGYLKEEY